MELDSTFSVVAPIDAVWRVLMDFDRVAGAVPGAEILNRLSDDALQVGMKIKLGPVAMQYKGLVNVAELDETAHRAVFSGKAQETRGQGTADGSATLTLSEADGTTTGVVHADLSLSGKAASMGKSVIASVTEQMMGLFAKNLQAMVIEDLGSGKSGTTSVDDVASRPAGDSSPTTRPTPSATTAAPISPTARASSAPSAGNSFNALSLVKGIVTDQLKNPAKLVSLLLIVGVVGFLIGRGRHSRTRR
jgi:carbon monoxide dehydrogenase subunit G